MAPLLAAFDRPYYQVGPFLVGVDEAGRGPLAGPVVAAACHLPKGVQIEGVNDSKRLCSKRRALVFAQLQEVACYAVGFASVEEIDRLNIYRASQLAMKRAIDALARPVDAVLSDAMPLPDLSCPVYPIIRGDSQSQLIAAASIIAKQTRDAWMQEQEQLYPGYGFAQHQGYPTAAHRAALNQLGPCPIHRRSYAPVAALLHPFEKEQLF